MEGKLYHRLALARGISVDELLDTTSSRELGDWSAYYAKEPWGIEAFDYLFAQLCAVMVNLWSSGGHTKGVEDFLLFSSPEVSKDAQLRKIMRMRSVAKSATERFGGTVNTHG